MGRVPAYIIIGSGHLAKHLTEYFRLSGINFLSWSRDNSPDFNSFGQIENNNNRLLHTQKNVTTVLLAISDDAIVPFANTYDFLKEKTLVHFSGALSTPTINSIHPLMTFSHEIYSLAEYQSISMVTERGQMTFQTIFPQLLNPSYEIDSAQKALYHSLCVAGGNFSNILWQSVFNKFMQLGLPPSALVPYITRTFKNILEQPFNSLTGPISRNDVETIAKNITALDGSILQKIYEDFILLNRENQTNLEITCENSRL